MVMADVATSELNRTITVPAAVVVIVPSMVAILPVVNDVPETVPAVFTALTLLICTAAAPFVAVVIMPNREFVGPFTAKFTPVVVTAAL